MSMPTVRFSTRGITLGLVSAAFMLSTLIAHAQIKPTRARVRHRQALPVPVVGPPVQELAISTVPMKN